MQINWWAILAAAVANMVIGSLWYSPLLFSKRWLELVGKKMQDINRADAGAGYLVAFGASLVQAYVMAHFVYYANYATGGTGVSAGLATGWWLWLGFVMVPYLVSYQFEGRPRQLLWINAGYFLAVLLVMGAIISAWA